MRKYVLLYTILSILLLTINIKSQWVQCSNGMEITASVQSLLSNGNNIFAGIASNGVYLSTNNGLNWTLTSLNFSGYYYSLLSNGNNIFAGTVSNGVYLSTNNGINWTQTSLNYPNVYSLATNGNNIFAGPVNHGVNRSTNNGLNWTQTSLDNQSVSALAINGNNIFAGNNYGVYLSTDNGTDWTQRNEGFTYGITIETFCLLNNYLIAGTFLHSVWKRYIPELVGINKESNEMPTRFELYQNYPNPFNPSTSIGFDILKSSFTKLIVYDITGREIETLINEELKAGNYKINFDGSNLSSGVYFYKLITSEYTLSRKMVLIK